MMIMLGNLTLNQIEERTGISVSDDDRAELNGMRQEKSGKHRFGEVALL